MSEVVSEPHRSSPFAACLVAYGIAMVAAYLVWMIWPTSHPLAIAFAANLVATMIIYASGVFARNSSMYDPYWSLQPIVLALFWVAHPVANDANHARIALVLGLVFFWGIRLTYNCFRRWPDLSHEDFRYTDMREQYGKYYPFVDLMGIMMMPTILVYVSSLPIFVATSAGTRALNWLDIIGVIVTLGAIIIELVADQQLQRFNQQNENPEKVCTEGLWSLSRHPNYFGEIGFWWGLWLLGLAADPSWWLTIIGPLLITALFVFISVPMMQKRKLLRRPTYEDQVKGISVLVPMPRKTA